MPGFDAFAVGPNTDPAAAMDWHVTGRSRRVKQEPAPNCMGKIVRWMGNAETPLIHKVGAVVLAAIATWVVGYLVGHTLLVFSATVVVVGAWAAMEQSAITKAAHQRILDAEQAAREAEQDRREQQASFAKMQEAVGGAEAWEALPILDIGERMGSVGNLDCITNQEVVAPIMKGRDRYGRPFLTMKLQPRENEEGPQAVTIFQRYPEGGRWAYVPHRSWLFQDPFENRDWDALRQIVTGQHARIVLAN